LAYFDNVQTVLLSEFKVQIAEYLAGLSHTRVRTLADLISFNNSDCGEEMKYFGQEIFELAEATSGNLSDPAYLMARQNALLFSRTLGIDRALQTEDLDAIVAPSYSAGSAPAAAAGYPSISVPVGVRPDGTPVGIWIYSGFLQEPKLLAFAYDLEQELKARRPPSYMGSVPAPPPDAGICPVLPRTKSENDAGLKSLRESLTRSPRLCCRLVQNGR
jgi:amidase